MRVGIDCRLWGESGVGRYIRNLVTNLQVLDRTNEYVLFVRSKDYENIKHQISNIKKNWKLEIGNWKLRRTDVRWHTLEEQLKLPTIINQENLDLVHFPYFSVPVFYNRPFVVTIHDLILHHFPTGEASTQPAPFYQLKLLGYKFVISQAAKKAVKVIAVSKATKEEIVDHLGISSDKVVVTYEGVDDALKSNIKNQRAKIHIKNQKYFLYVGNAYPHKNLERLVDAFNILISQYPNISLVLVGKDDYFYKKLRDKVKKMSLANHVVFHGEAEDDKLVGLYRGAKALVMPSLMEGFGLPALEAMANGCFVLASDIPSLREVCASVAIYFNPLSIEDLAKKIKTIHYYNTYHYSEKIKNGIERANIFSWQKMARETLKIYESCVRL